MEMAQLVSCLLYKHEGPELDLLNPHFFFKKRAMCDGMCLQPQYQGGRGKQIFVVHWPISLDYLLCSRPVKDKYLHPTKDAQG